MFKQLDLKIIGGIVIIAVLLVAGIHFYSKWSYNRFATEIGAAPQSTTPSEPVSEPDKITSSEQSKSTQSVNENVKVKPMVKSELANTGKEKEGSAEKTETPGFDASSLMSTFGIPEEVKSLLDEDAEEADFEKAQAYLAEKYGQSSEVDAIMDRLRQMSGGPVKLDDLTALFEDWIEILPEEQQENRRQLMGVLTLLNQAKAQVGSNPVHVIVGTNLDDIDPSLLEGDNVQRFNVHTTKPEVVDVKTRREIIDD